MNEEQFFISKDAMVCEGPYTRDQFKQMRASGSLVDSALYLSYSDHAGFSHLRPIACWGVSEDALLSRFLEAASLCSFLQSLKGFFLVTNLTVLPCSQLAQIVGVIDDGLLLRIMGSKTIFGLPYSQVISLQWGIQHAFPLSIRNPLHGAAKQSGFNKFLVGEKFPEILDTMLHVIIALERNHLVVPKGGFGVGVAMPLGQQGS
jgi:hypothetical protein